MRNELMCCANCEYWSCYDEEGFNKKGGLVEGECHRYPPSVPNFENGNDGVEIKDVVFSLINGTLLMSNPFTFAEDWCGEFEWMDDPRWTEEDVEYQEDE